VAIEIAGLVDTVQTSESLAHYSDQVDVMERAIVAISLDKDVSVSDTTTLSESVATTLAHNIVSYRKCVS
jgi:hypothetical protein